MTYAELLPALIEKNLVQTRTPPPLPEKLPWWHRADHFCAFHQGAPGHDIEQCWALKYEVQKLIKANTLSFKDMNPNVQANPLPNHGASSINMVQGCPGTYLVFDIRHIQKPLVQMHVNLCKLAFFQHNHAACETCPHYKNFFHYPQTFTHGSMTVENVKTTDDLPTSKTSIKLRICYKLLELLPMA
jgi:hypothetical protein